MAEHDHGKAKIYVGQVIKGRPTKRFFVSTHEQKLARIAELRKVKHEPDSVLR